MSAMKAVEPDRKEIYRYMGCRTADVDEKMRGQVEEAIAKLQGCITPRSTRRSYEILRPGDGSLVIGGIHTKSRNLAKNLRDCERCCVFAATLGMGPDHLIRRAQAARMSRALALQAASAAMIEAYCDEINEEIAREERVRGNFLRPRFSPGYGDFPLEHQREIEQMLQMDKTIGISLTATLMMMPSKSVTALVGISRQDAGCVREGCEQCGKTDCAYRRN